MFIIFENKILFIYLFLFIEIISFKNYFLLLDNSL